MATQSNQSEVDNPLSKQVGTPVELRRKAHQTLDAYLDAGGPYEFVIISKTDYERNKP
jgi:hypothetical protein